MRATGALILLVLGTVVGALVSSARAEVVPAPGIRDTRVRSVPYDADQIYRLQAHVGYQIELEFEPGELVTGQGAGDLEGVAFDAFANHFFIKPKATDTTTNLTIVTNRRRYRFHYIVSGEPPDLLSDDSMFLVRFRYPPTSSSIAPSLEDQTEQRFAATSHVRSRNVDYWYCGDPSVRPTAASDDGVHTRLTFPARSELPAIFVRNNDGAESLLNFSIDAGDVVVHRIAPRLIVRRGRLAGCIVNKGFSGSGERLESGTVSPDVRRERVELPP